MTERRAIYTTNKDEFKDLKVYKTYPAWEWTYSYGKKGKEVYRHESYTIYTKSLTAFNCMQIVAKVTIDFVTRLFSSLRYFKNRKLPNRYIDLIKYSFHQARRKYHNYFSC